MSTQTQATTLIAIATEYRVSGIARSGEIYGRDSVSEWNCAPVDADNTALNYDLCRVYDGRSRAGVIRAWCNVWRAPGVCAGEDIAPEEIAPVCECSNELQTTEEIEAGACEWCSVVETPYYRVMQRGTLHEFNTDGRAELFEIDGLLVWALSLERAELIAADHIAWLDGSLARIA